MFLDLELCWKLFSLRVLKAVVHWFLEPAVVTRGRPLQETWLSGSCKGLVLILKGLLFNISVLKYGSVLFFSVFELPS
jgi:hypothetical protein